MTSAVKTDRKTQSITLKLKWFSILAEHRGRRSENVQVPAGTPGAELIENLAKDFPLLQKYRNHVRIAVNREYVDADHVLQDGDEVAFITPVSGG